VSNRYSFGTEETYQTQTNSHSNPTQFSVDTDEDENDYYDQYDDDDDDGNEQEQEQTLDDIIDDFWNAIDVNKHNIHHRESFIVKKLKSKQPAFVNKHHGTRALRGHGNDWYGNEDDDDLEIGHAVVSHRDDSYLVQRSIMESMFECKDQFQKMNPNRVQTYIDRHEWRKALKYLLRCQWAFICDSNQDMICLEQFKFALYHRCHIQNDLSHAMLPVLTFQSKRNHSQYVITCSSFVHWMLKHAEQTIDLLESGALKKDRKFEKRMAAIGYVRKRLKKKRKQNRLHQTVNPFVAVSPKRYEVNQMERTQSTQYWHKPMEPMFDANVSHQNNHLRPHIHSSKHRRSISQGNIENLYF